MVSGLQVYYWIHPTLSILTKSYIWNDVILIKFFYILPIVFKFKPQSGIQHHIHHLSDPYKGEDGWGGVVTVLYMWDWGHVLEA